MIAEIASNINRMNFRYDTSSFDIFLAYFQYFFDFYLIFVKVPTDEC
jgi:hypothetical protein